MGAEHNDKKRKIFEKFASPLPSSPLLSSPLPSSPLPSSPLLSSPSAQTTNSSEFLYYDTNDEFESEEEIEMVVEEDVKLGIWELWKKVLENMQTQNNVDKYSLENLNVIQLGNKIGSETTRKYYPKNLIYKTEMIIKEIPDFFVEDQDFYNRVFDMMTLADEKSLNEFLAEIYFSVFKSNKPFMKFFHAVVQSFASGLFIEDSDIYKLEISYNHRIIWPIIDCLSKMIETTKFHPGEVRLQAICDELKLLYKDDRSYYNADGIIINSKHKIEVAVVETTGPFHLSNTPKETHDYVKAGYGLVSMLHCIGQKFPYGNFDTFKKIGVFFIQVTRLYLNFFNLANIINFLILIL
ncbi:unnamed protein product [Rhizopus stolonifer]